jgi:predicted RNase H-like HicB family nuclease
MRRILGITFNYDVNKRDGCFVASCNDVGIVVYGNTKAAARKRLNMAIDIWADTLSKNGILIDRLNDWGIDFKVTTVMDAKPRINSTTRNSLILDKSFSLA